MGVVSRRRVWLVGVGGIYGCGCKEVVYRFPHTTYPYSSCICSFLQQHPYFLFIFKMFFVLVIIRPKKYIIIAKQVRPRKLKATCYIVNFVTQFISNLL